MKVGRPVEGLPRLACIATFRAETDRSSIPGVAETLLKISQRYGSSSLVNGSVRFTSDALEGYITALDGRDWQAYLLTLSSREEPAFFSVEDRSIYEDQMKEILALLPENRFSLLTLRTGWSSSRHDAEAVLKRYLKTRSLSPRSVGVVHNSFLATVEEKQALEAGRVSEKQIVAIPFDPTREDAETDIWALLDDLAQLALFRGKLDLLLSEREAMFSQIEASEKSTQLRINQIFADIRRPPEQVKPADLESMLTEVTILFSRLSVAASAMTRDYVLAGSHLRDMRSLFKKWNEGISGDYPTNSAVEMDTYERLVAPFKDFVDRVDALRVQLNTILDAVRTYLGIQQESLSIEEQKSSKNQLVRLVNLQEILHKLEMLIVAVYLTEMAKIVFDAVERETADIRTALFIPVALVLSIIIGRLLHREK